jgi:hypothetical protein
VIAFRNVPPGIPFFWESSTQRAQRWHADGAGPVQYLATTPDAAWAEFLRHAEITDPDEVADVRRAIWAVEIPDDEAYARPALSARQMIGDDTTYTVCQAEARRLRDRGAASLRAPSAAIQAGASGFRVDGGLVPGPRLAEETIVLFGRRSDLRGWQACAAGHPGVELLSRVRHLR